MAGQRNRNPMQWYQTIFDLIDMRSFSSLWYWIVVAVTWSMSSHWIIGVPYDMLTRARRHGGKAAEDLDMLAHIYAGRLSEIGGHAGLALVGFASFVVATLATLGFGYDVELAQAVLCLFLPMCLVVALSIRTARRIQGLGETGPELWRRLTMHRFTVQGIGILSLFVTGMYGMWHNLQLSVFG